MANLNIFVFGISYITVFYIGLSALFIIAFIYILKPKSIIKFVEHIGLRTRAQEQEQTETASDSTPSNDNSGTKSPKTDKKVKKTEDPILSTKLSTPIENVIELVKEDPKLKNSPSTSKKKAKTLSKSNHSPVKEDSKPKPVETIKSDKSPKKKVSSKPKDDTAQLTKVTQPELPIDDIGFSFFPVKEKSKSNKKDKDIPSPEGNKKSKENPPKSSTPDHNKREIKRSTETTIPKKSVKVSEAHKSPIIKPVEEKLQSQDKSKNEIKESKKVCSSISFASVVTNNIPEAKDNSDTNKNLAEDRREQTNTADGNLVGTSSLRDSEIKSDESVELLSLVLETVNSKQHKEDEKVDVLPEPAKELQSSKVDEIDTCSIKHTVPDIEKVTLESSGNESSISLENLSKSSSIEVICEEQHNTDIQSSHFENVDENLKENSESQTQFEIIEKDLNKLVQSSESDDIFCRSQSSSICVIDNPIEGAGAELAKKEEKQSTDNLSTDDIKTESSPVEQSDNFIDSTKNSDTFIVSEKESETVGTIEYSTRCQDCVEIFVADCLKECEDQTREQFDAEDYCVIEKTEPEGTPQKENNYTSAVTKIQNSVEELQNLENSEPFVHEHHLEEVSDTCVFIEETHQEESEVKNFECEHQTVFKETINLAEGSNTDRNTEKTEKPVAEDTECLLNQQIQKEKVELQKNIISHTKEINQEFLRLEKESESIFEEILNTLGISQLAEEIEENSTPNTGEINDKLLQLEKDEDTENKLEFEEIQNNSDNPHLVQEEIAINENNTPHTSEINEELLPLENSEGTENKLDFEEHNDLDNSQLAKEKIEIKENITSNTNEVNKEFLSLAKPEVTENKLEFEEIQNNLNNPQLDEEEIEIKKNSTPNTNEVNEELHLEKEEETENKPVIEENKNNITTNTTEITEEFLQLEKAEETENKTEFEEIQNDLNKSELDEEGSELMENITPRSSEIYEELHLETENKLNFEQLQNKLNNTQLVDEEISELANLKLEELPFDKTYLVAHHQEHLENLQEVISVEENLETFEEDVLVEMASSQIRVLTLNDREHQECTLYRIEKNWAIQFRLGPSLFGRKVYLYCNYPVDNKGTLAKFNRGQYQLLGWVLDEGCKNADDTAVYTQIDAKLSGSFHYYFTFEKRENAERQGSGFFLVDPILKYGNNEDLPLDCIQCQTVLAKSLGSFSTWEKKLQVAKESGYNMVHFTPIQELGISNSSYSLSEQLKLNTVFKKENGKMPSFEEIKTLLGKIRKDWKMTSICDIVLNHTANESEWIKVHPEVTYNCINCPYMRPAYLLDAAFHQFSMDIKNGFYEDKGIPIEVDHEDHLNAIRYHFRKSVLEALKIEELFICDTNKLAAEFFALARNTPPVTVNYKAEQEELRIFQDKEFRRLAATVDMTLALKLYNVYRNDSFDEDSRLKRCTEEFKSKLDSLNNAIIVDINDHLAAGVENVIAGIRYFRVQLDGPRVKEITIKNPLVYRYFTDYGTPKSIEEHEETMYSSNGRFLMAHNGWVMNSDPLKNFAAPDSSVYLRRELIAWGDSVKLRYGDEPKDCPFLWEHMKKYVEQTADLFDGVRLDNCHSTPIPVAEYLLDCARRVRPDLYVVAELFTNSDMTDNIFVNRLGITSLIREAMSAWDSHEEGRLVYRYGGSPVGSFYQPRIRPLVPSIAHALFLDLTHDNPSPVEKRSVFDLLPSTALVNMACCASGSNRGYDELVPHHIHVVDETRQYTEWTEDENLASGSSRYVTKKSGIILAKKAVNDIHFTLGKEGYNQVYVDQIDPDIVAVTRHRPDTHESYILVAFTAFGHPSEDAGHYQRGIKALRFEGVLDEIVLEATLSHVSVKTGGSKFARPEKYTKDPKWVNGLSEYQVALKQHIQANESDIFEKVDAGTPNVTQLNFKNFKPGSVVVIKTSLPETMKEAVKSVRFLINQFSIRKETELSCIIDKLTLADLNRIIYRCDQEERDEGFGFDTYHIPNFGSLVYAGLQGFISLLANIRPNNDLGHPMCANLRDGNWMIEYIWRRLNLDVNTHQLGQWIEENTKFFNSIPRYLVPSYFDVVVTGIYVLLVEQCYKLSSNFVSHGSTFVRGLSLGSVQFAAYIKSADLPVLSPNLAPPKPPTRKNDKGENVQTCVTLCAGLPHFTVGYMRNWGRDTFIALRGLFILTGRFEEARQHILGYGACLRHGLIPNLLDGGRNSRFNCRDAVWWWLYCIKEYVEEAPNGANILTDKVSRIFPTDDSPAQPPGAVDQPLHDVIQEALKVHFQGLAFRERNAGRQIDEHMTDIGFNNQIGIHPETGFVFGGNRWNCGTWMDKMGSSDKAGNRGKPATPRDGSAVELVGLSKAVVSWLWKLSQNKKYPYNGVERTHKNGSVTKWTFKEWGDKIQANFEKYFWVNNTPVPEEYRSDLINKRGIYKDSFGASQDWADFQLRCNYPIAMVAAPELFTPQQAWTALNQAEKYLLGPLGMKTLDPEDWAYHGDYDNSNDSDDPSVAHGFNYHQGPEWVWPLGFFLRAKLHFASLNGVLNETIASTKVVLSKHFTELQSSVWRGLPELTNSNGSYCRDSSRTQAWSMACILEVLHDLQKIESSNQPVLIN